MNAEMKDCLYMFGLFILTLIYNFNASSDSTVVVCLCAIEKIDESVGVCLLAVLAVKDGGRRMLAKRSSKSQLFRVSDIGLIVRK